MTVAGGGRSGESKRAPDVLQGWSDWLVTNKHVRQRHYRPAKVNHPGSKGRLCQRFT